MWLPLKTVLNTGVAVHAVVTDSVVPTAAVGVVAHVAAIRFGVRVTVATAIIVHAVVTRSDPTALDRAGVVHAAVVETVIVNVAW